MRLFSVRLMLSLRVCTLRRAVISRALLSLLNQMRFAVLALAGAASAAAFAPSSVSPLRGSKSLCMSAQAAPPAKLEHPKAKVEAEAVNAKQWGTKTLTKPAVNHPSTGTGSEACPTARSKHAASTRASTNRNQNLNHQPHLTCQMSLTHQLKGKQKWKLSGTRYKKICLQKRQIDCMLAHSCVCG